MGPGEAIDRLVEVSADVRAAVLFDGRAVLASTFDDAERAGAFAAAASELLDAASELRPSTDAAVEHVHAALGDRGVFVVRADTRTIAATVGRGAGSTVTLYDLKTCLEDSTGAERRGR